MVNSEKEYALGRDTKAAVRLHAQHHFVGMTQGFQLDPFILKKYADKNKHDKIAIADAGAGTGIWAFEVARILGEKCFVHGFDISAAAFPHETCDSEWHNVKLTGGIDLLGQLPINIQNTYDIVNARFWTLILRESALPLVKNLWHLCKPGGWVQMTDAHMDEHWVIYPEGIKAEDTKRGTEGVLAGFRSFHKILGVPGMSKAFEWQRTLESAFSETGFVSYEFLVHRAPEPYASYNSDQLLVLGEELANNALLAGKEKDVDEDAARRLLQAAADGKEESLRGIHMNWTLFSVRAQRPVTS